MTPFPLPSEAQDRILAAIAPISDQDIVPLNQALGRILAQPLTATLDMPLWDNSAMDGYALRYEEVAQANLDRPVALTVQGEIAAGQTSPGSLPKGAACRVFTGAMMPTGADTVVMQEVCQRDGDRVWITQAPKEPGEFVRAQGSYYRQGDRLLPSGLAIGPAEWAILAATQIPTIPVVRRPQVVIFSTGNELIPPDAEGTLRARPLQPGQIVDSNQYAIQGFLQPFGVEIISLGIVGDRRELVREVMVQAIRQGDLVLSTGGVSVGDYDYIPELLGELGGTSILEKVAMKPGKPLKVAQFSVESRPCLYVGLPGNPVSALVGCWRFVAPALHKLSGHCPPYGPTMITAQTIHPLTSDGHRETYLWGRFVLDASGPQFHLAPGRHQSANLINLQGTNGLAILPQGRSFIPAGEPVTVLVPNLSK